jgi:hypothetical protein
MERATEISSLMAHGLRGMWRVREVESRRACGLMRKEDTEWMAIHQGIALILSSLLARR